jgi:outer membrane protein TolC
MKIKYLILLICVGFTACKIPALISKQEDKTVPAYYNTVQDSTNIASVKWRQYFTDPYLIAIIDSALKNNQELNMALREIEMDKNEIQARKGEYLPFVNLAGVAGIDKTGKYTWDGLAEEDLKASPEKGPKYIGDFRSGIYASWELDVWKKLRNAKKSAVVKYLSTIEGRNFIVTNLIAEISSSYYELLALDNMMSIVQQNIELQKNALQMVKLEKEAAKVSQLAVNRFDAQLLHTQNLQYDIQQQIVETENKINFLLGRFSQKIIRDKATFSTQMPAKIKVGIPSQLLVNRPDIKQAELELLATKCDARAARLEFYPSLDITSSMGFQAFKPSYLLRTPQSLLYSLVSDVAGPIVNRKAITAEFNTANALQVEALYNYQKSILNGISNNGIYAMYKYLPKMNFKWNTK